MLTDAREVSVVQLQLLDVMIGKKNAAVPMDAAARADLIDLMARILVVVFQAEGARVDDRGPVQSQDQAGAPGSQSDRLLTAIQRETGTAEQGKPASSV
jgi:hypothetical protein